MMTLRTGGRALAAAALLLVGGMVTAEPVHAWDELGHRVVARIAWDHMTPAARARAIELLMAAPQDAALLELFPRDGRPLEVRQREYFIMASVWPDLIRGSRFPGAAGQSYAHSEWHYVNHFWEQPRPGARGVPRPDMGRAGLLVEKLQEFDGPLGDASRPLPERAVELAWVLHLVGDGHQPMHNSARVTPQEPEGDRGGNLFLLNGRLNLHSYWDRQAGPSFPWTRGDTSSADYVGSIAQRVVARHPLSSVRHRLHPGEVERWSLEGAEIAMRHLYPANLRRGEAPPRSYRAMAQRIAAERLAMAGYRLADYLNRNLG
jgi:hypothetical protein